MNNEENNTQQKQQFSYEMSEALVSALHSGIKFFKEALVQRRNDVLSNLRLLHVVISRYLEQIKAQEDDGQFFRTPPYGKFMGNFKPQDISAIIVTKQAAKPSRVRIAVATVDDEIIPDTELGNLPLNQLIMFAYFVQERLEALSGRRLFRPYYLQEYLTVNNLDITLPTRPWMSSSRRPNNGYTNKTTTYRKGNNTANIKRKK